MPHRIPLSHTPFDLEAFAATAARFRDVPHEDVVRAFEQVVRQQAGRPTVALQSGTAAIHLGLRALGVGPGDVVLVPSFTYIATANPVRYLGATPMFIDSEESTWNMDPERLAEALHTLGREGITPRALLVVHTYGVPARMHELMALARQAGVPVLEDAAEAWGAHVGGQPVGTFGQVGIFSFNNNKTWTTYGGGALLAQDQEVADKVRFWATQSREPKPYYEHHQLGYNYRMGLLSALHGLAQAGTAGEAVQRRQAIRARYLQQVGPGAGQAVAEGSAASGWLSAVRLPSALRVRVAESLENEGIEYRRGWNPLHRQPLYAGSRVWGGGVSERLFEEVICLPSSQSLGEAGLAEVLRCLQA